MKDANPISVPLGSHFKLRKVALSENEVKEIKKIHYATTVGSLVYAMMYTRLDITHVVGSMSKFLANPGKEYYQSVK